MIKKLNFNLNRGDTKPSVGQVVFVTRATPHPLGQSTRACNKAILNRLQTVPPSIEHLGANWKLGKIHGLGR